MISAGADGGQDLHRRGRRKPDPRRATQTALASERQPEIYVHLVRKIYETRPSVVLASALGGALVGGLAAVRVGDIVMMFFVLLIVVATLSLLPLLLSFRRVTELDVRNMIRWERRLAISSILVSGGVSLLFVRSLQVSSDPLVHLLPFSVLLGAVTTVLRNYFRPWLVLTQLGMLLGPSAVATAIYGQPVYLAISLGMIALAYNVFGITAALYADAVALLLSREELSAQNNRFDAALSNMSHGLCMFDENERLLVCNMPYLDIYGFDRSVVAPGIQLRDLIEYSCILGNHSPLQGEEIYRSLQRSVKAGAQDSFHHHISDGRVILVSHQPMAGGGWVATHTDVTAKREAEARVEFMAKHDIVTGLANRLLFHDRLELALLERSADEEVAVLVIDLDRFKEVNDTLGHHVGDEVLKGVAERLQDCAFERGLVARFGGDEFAVVLVGAIPPEAASETAELIIARIREPFDVGGHRVVIGASIGVSLARQHSSTASDMLKEADLALYAAKADGRGACRFFTPDMQERIQARRALEMDLRAALARGEFELVYQPLVDLASGRATCFEALLRWHHPRRGLVLPGEFISLAEEIGVIRQIGDWVLYEACRQAAFWPKDISVAVNLSPEQLRGSSITSTALMALARSGLNPCRLELEITEGAILKQTEATLFVLHQLREIGIRIALDDFGTGYSSLSYLRLFPFDKIKIDQSFVSELEHSEDARAIVRAVTALGASLKMVTTAEGVETKEQLARLQAEGCQQVQGFLIGRPATASQIATMLETRLRAVG